MGFDKPMMERIRDLEVEIARLKRGDFTKEEIHDFCHNLHGKVTAREFCAGCEAEQRKYFNEAPTRDRLVSILSAMQNLIDVYGDPKPTTPIDKIPCDPLADRLFPPIIEWCKKHPTIKEAWCSDNEVNIFLVMSAETFNFDLADEIGEKSQEWCTAVGQSINVFQIPDSEISNFVDPNNDTLIFERK